MARLPTPGDVLRACAWRIGPLDAAGEALARVEAWLSTHPPGEAIGEDSPTTQAIMAEIRRPGERRSAWGLFAALLALAYLKRNNLIGFFQAGQAVLVLYEQGMRGKARNGRRDDLTLWLQVFIADNPDAATSDIVQALITTAGHHDTVDDYDPVEQVFSYCPNQARGKLHDIPAPAVVRRIQRIKAATATG